MPGGTTKTDEPCNSADSMSEVTRQLCAAAHLRHNVIYKPLEARFNTLMADTPEYFVDMELLHREAESAHNREILRQWIVVVTVAATGWVTIIRGGTRLLVSVVCVIGLLGLIELLFEIHRQEYVRSHFLRENFFLEKSRGVEPNLEHNIVISGGFSPFIGSGTNVFSWSFVVDLAKPSGEMPPQPLLPTELYEEVTVSLRELKIPGLEVWKRLFIHGEELRECTDIGPHCLPYPLSQPKRMVPENVMEDAEGGTLNHLRYYRMLQIPTWGGQLVLSLFLKFTPIGSDQKSLFVEVKLFMLLPLRPEFREVDNLTKRITWGQYRYYLWRSAIKAPFTWIGAGLAGLSAAMRFFSPEIDGQREDAKDNERFNYGWSRSLREQWSDGFYEDYFQMLDKDMYSKILQARLIDAIVSILEARGISTEAIKEQRTTILKQGIFVNGKFEAQNVAVGPNPVAAAVKQVFGGGAKSSLPTGSSSKS